MSQIIRDFNNKKINNTTNKSKQYNYQLQQLNQSFLNNKNEFGMWGKEPTTLRTHIPQKGSPPTISTTEICLIFLFLLFFFSFFSSSLSSPSLHSLKMEQNDPTISLTQQYILKRNS